MKDTNKNGTKIKDKYSTKIKDIYVELQNYTFFHRPSGVDYQDDRFIGREQVINKLKAILSFSETKSGAYLVTGFRGMGKTSVVNKVIAELKSKDGKGPGFYRYIRIFLAVFLFSFFDVVSIFQEVIFLDGVEDFWYRFFLLMIIPFIILLASINYFITESIDSPSHIKGELGSFNYAWNVIVNKVKNFEKILDFKRGSNHTSNYLKILCQDYFIASIIFISSIFILLAFYQPIDDAVVYYDFEYYKKFQVTIISYVLIVYLFSNWDVLIKDFSNKNLKPYLFLFLLFFLFVFCVLRCRYKASPAFPPAASYLIFFTLILAVGHLVLTIWKKTKVAGKILAVFTGFVLIIIAGNGLMGRLSSGYLEDPNAMAFVVPFVLLILIFRFITNSLSYVTFFIASYVFGATYCNVAQFGVDQFLMALLYIFIGLVIVKVLLSYRSFAFRKQLVSFFNTSHITEIKINLGQDNLAEKDILRLIAKSILSKYKAIRSPFYSFRRFSWVVLFYFVTYTIALVLFHYRPTYRIINEVRQASQLSFYCPSQAIFSKNIESTKSDSSDNKNVLLSYKNEEEKLKEIERYEGANSNKYGVNMYAAFLFYGKSEILEEDNIEFQKQLETLFISKKRIDTSTKIDTTINPTTELEVSTQNEYLNEFEYKKKSKLKENLWHIAVRIDYFIFILYNEISQFIIEAIPNFILDKETNKEVGLLNQTLDLHDNFHFLPPRIDYVFLLFYLIMHFIISFIASLVFAGVRHKEILKKLQRLVDGIDASVAQEKNSRLGRNKGLFFERKFQKIYPILGERDIENELISILNQSDKTPAISLRPKFIFIFDELDKIEPTGKFGKLDDDETNSDTYTTEGTRKREEAIGRILSNLKHFFNTAKAKFIFIAGREMYDASLADISDRDSLIGSIFHDVLYVPSFYQDPYDGKLSDISSMTERYVCKFLIPKIEIKNKEDYSLATYFKYLNKTFGNDKESIRRNAHVVMTLQNFITYLTYRSNGSPKKITKLFEEYVFPIGLEENSFSDIRQNEILIGKKVNQLYLHFEYYDQYIFGFSNYLFNPFLLSVSKYMKDFGDKLLVSTSFLLNHIYKYHNTGFSFRTLELTPEIIAINKAPELRSFIERLLQFLSKTHIREILSGLHQFKFNSKIEREIAFISKISEKESAAFNFTLDESLEIKRLYRRRLLEARNKYKFKEEFLQFDSSVAYLNHILGDLHYHDQEYDRAVVYYKDAVQFIHDVKGVLKNNIVFYTRTMLKAGMTYEKKRNYDDALLIYENLKYEIEEFAENFNAENINNPIKSNAATALRLLYQPILAELQLIEKHSIKSITKHYLRKNVKQFEQIISNTQLKPEQSFLLKVEYLNKIGDLLYYKNGLLFGERYDVAEEKEFYVKEKQTVKVTSSRGKYVKQLDEDVFKVERVKLFEKSSDYSKFRDIEIGNNKLRYFPISAYKYYMKSIEELLIRVSDEEFSLDPERLFSIDNMKKGESTFLHLTAKFYFKRTGKEFPIRRKAVYMALGNCLSDVGDCILTFNTLGSQSKISFENLEKILSNDFGNYYSEDTVNEDASAEAPNTEKLKAEAIKAEEANTEKAIKDYEGLTSMERSFRFTYLAALSYLRAGELKEYAFQITKILHVLNEMPRDSICQNTEKEGDESAPICWKRLKDLIESIIIKKGIRSLLRSYENTNEIEIGKYRSIFKEELKGDKNEENKLNHNLLYNSTAASADIKEMIILYKELELKFDSNSIKLEDCFIDSYTSLNNSYNRLRELVYKSKFNYKLLENELGGEISGKRIYAYVETDEDKENGERKERIDLVAFLITDSVYCLNEMIKKLNIYGASYIHNHNWLASTYKKLGDWCEILNQVKDECSDLYQEMKIDEVLEKLLGKTEVLDLNPYNIYDKAIHHYYSVKETHSEGGAYKHILENMYYLDDSFNDNLYHFCAALERRHLNAGHIDDQIVKLKRKIFPADKDYKYKAYDLNSYV